MPRRMSLPGAEELFRSTSRSNDEKNSKGSSGRVRHDEKITIYLSGAELLALEQARLHLRSQGLSVDRGKLVREAIALALTDLDEHGEDSGLYQRLGG